MEEKDQTENNSNKIRSRSCNLRPFLKWPGNKRKIVNELMEKFPEKMNNYYEPFIGGGSVFIELLQNIKKGTITVEGDLYLSDINPTLIKSYIAVRDNVDELIANLVHLKKEYLSIEYTKPDKEQQNKDIRTRDEAMKSRQNYFYWIRHRYNSRIGDRVSQFIFLNNTCCRANHREKKGKIISTYGNYKNPRIFNQNNLKGLSNLFQDIEFDCLDFRDSIHSCDSFDFVYLDPPYLDKKLHTIRYTDVIGFDITDHKELFEWCRWTKSDWLMNNQIDALIHDYLDLYQMEEIDLTKRNRSQESDNTNSIGYLISSNRIVEM